MSPRRSPARPAWAVVILLATAACGDENFSQFPGFAAYDAAHPRSATIPSAADRALAGRYRPRVYLPAGHAGPIDFYADYVGHGVLKDGNGQVVSTAVTAPLLNAYRDDPKAAFAHVAPARPAETRPTVYARVDRAGAADYPPNLPPQWRRDLTFLTYTLVFPQSGLPAGVPVWVSGLADLVADPDDWHQLDHYTSVTIALDARDQPFAALFQHHNYTRTYLVGRDIDLPADSRLAIDVALRSNEIYPHKSGRHRRRAVAFLDGDALGYMLADAPGPWLSADDITESAGETDYRLAFLPQTDAFYRFKGWLGERRNLPGRDGPPGADFSTWPSLMPLPIRLFASYWRPGDRAALRAYQAFFEMGATDAAARDLATKRAQALNADWREARN